MAFNTYKDRTLIQMKILANEQNAKIERLEAECFKLAAGVCEHRSGDEHGNPYCLKSKTNI